VGDGGRGEERVETGPEGIRGFDELGVDGSGGIVIGRSKLAS